MVLPRSAVLVSAVLACLAVGPVAVATAETLSDVQHQLERRSAELAAARTAAESAAVDSSQEAVVVARRLERQKSRLVARASDLAREAARAAQAAAAAAATLSVTSASLGASSGGFVTTDLAASPFGPSSLLPGVGGPPPLGSHIFPIAAASTFSDDWGAPRAGGRRHEGIDLFAARGTPVVAVADGTLSRVGYSGISGNRLWLKDGSGMAFFYAHLDGYSAAAREGAFVRQGAVLGFTGDTGDAKGTPPHVHFEIRPGGGEPVQPYPIVSRWPRLARAG
jgi:murein DD-endopeptidase MepM/ murein hydrolase activator NlpD